MFDSIQPAARSRLALSRRTLLAGAAAGLLTRGVAPHVARAAQSAGPQPPGAWQTWLLTSGDELRPSPPGPPGAAELAEVRRLQGQRNAGVAAMTAKWATAPAMLPWTNLA
ncbi:MAG TPA: hypothetical protein VFQ80_14175, partial [Thermomicrobiales bacterium]|nr:hypothetical protein [Thermomicrobiales bacterium]